MLTEAQYKELLRYRDDDILFNGEPDEMMRFLIRKKYIIRYHPVSSDGAIRDETFCAICEPGRQALEEFEEHVREERAEQEKNKEMMKAQRAADRFNTIVFGTVSAAIGSIVGGLIVYYWSDIINFLIKVFQQ